MMIGAITRSITRDVETLQHVLKHIRIDDVRRDEDRFCYVDKHKHNQNRLKR